MDLLESLQPADIRGQLIWCYYEKSRPNDRIVNLVTGLNGVLVPVPDFDLLMVLLGEKMGISTLDEEINRRAAARTDRYRHRIQLLDTVDHPSVAQALASTLERSGGWWVWLQKGARLQKPTKSGARLSTGREFNIALRAASCVHTLLNSFGSNARIQTRPNDSTRERSRLEPGIVRCLRVGQHYLTYEKEADYDHAETLRRAAIESVPSADSFANLAYSLRTEEVNTTRQNCCFGRH